MCGMPDARGYLAATQLASLIKRELFVTVDPVALRLCVHLHEEEVAPLAHAIHRHPVEAKTAIEDQ